MSKQKICNTADLIPNSGVCALLNDDAPQEASQEQIAIFYLPETEEKVFAINNCCLLYTSPSPRDRG